MRHRRHVSITLVRNGAAAAAPAPAAAARLVRQGLAKKVERSRKQLKEKKNRTRKIRGIKKNK